MTSVFQNLSQKFFFLAFKQCSKNRQDNLSKILNNLRGIKMFEKILIAVIISVISEVCKILARELIDFAKRKFQR